MFLSAYSRVAGLQSETARVALTRVAGREKDYNQRLNTFRKHMHYRITAIKQQQEQLKKSVQEYSLKLKQNKRDREARLQSDLAFDKRCLRLAMESERKMLNEIEDDDKDSNKSGITAEQDNNVLPVSKQNEDILKRTIRRKSVYGSTLPETNNIKDAKMDCNKSFHLRRHSLTSENNTQRNGINVLNSAHKKIQKFNTEKVVSEYSYHKILKETNTVAVRGRNLENKRTNHRENILAEQSSRANAILANKTIKTEKCHVISSINEGKSMEHMNEVGTTCKLDSRGRERTARFADRDSKLERLQDIKNQKGMDQGDPLDARVRQKVPDTRDNIFYKGPHGAQGVSLDLIRKAAIIFPLRYGYSEHRDSVNKNEREDNFLSESPSNARQYWQVIKQKQLRKKRASSRSYALWKRIAKNAKLTNTQHKSKWKTLSVNHVLQVNKRGPEARTKLGIMNEDRINGRSGEMKSSGVSMTSGTRLFPLLSDVVKRN